MSKMGVAEGEAEGETGLQGYDQGTAGHSALGHAIHGLVPGNVPGLPSSRLPAHRSDSSMLAGTGGRLSARCPSPWRPAFPSPFPAHCFGSSWGGRRHIHLSEQEEAAAFFSAQPSSCLVPPSTPRDPGSSL